MNPLRAFGRDLWNKTQEDDIFFLAGGLAFNILLAGVPFFLLLASGLGYILGQSLDVAYATIQSVLNMLLPARLAGPGETILDPILADIVRTRAVSGLFGLLGFLWFSTRLFGSLRSVMGIVFERHPKRNFLRGKLWDFYLAASSAVLITVWVTVNTFLVVGTGRIGSALSSLGVLDDVVSGVEVLIARIISIVALMLIFFSLYRWLPSRRTPWRIALVGGGVAVALLETARWVFASFAPSLNAGSLYTGTLAALVIVVFWVYYAAVIFIIGAEVAHAAEKALAPLAAP